MSMLVGMARFMMLSLSCLTQLNPGRGKELFMPSKNVKHGMVPICAWCYSFSDIAVISLSSLSMRELS